MKQPFTKSVAAIIVCMLLLSFMPPQAKKGEVDIVDGRKAETTSLPKPVSHSTYDVTVRRTNEFYRVTYYGGEPAPYSYHSASFGSTEDFDKAQYQWVNDSTVAINLYSTKSAKTAKFKVWGKRDSSGMDTE
jgi:hypothetical protein